MSILNKFRKFRLQFFEQAGRHIEVAPWTRKEADDIAAGVEVTRMSDRPRNSLFGMDMYHSPYAEQIRQRIIEQSVYSPAMDKETICELKDHRSRGLCAKTLGRSLSAKIVADVSHVIVTVEFDPWARIKRALRLTKYFPIKTKEFVIEGTILYPHLKVNFPAARHHVKLKLVE